MNLNERSSGILLPLSSLPGPQGCGDLGRSARRFADFLVRAGQRWWQMLPINPIDDCFSPYASYSAFAGDPIYIDLEDLLREGLLHRDELDWSPEPPRIHTTYHVARDYRAARWQKAFERFRRQEGGEKYLEATSMFFERNHWVRAHALFCALSEKYETNDWSTWPDEAVRCADIDALKREQEELEERVAYHAFLQLVFDVQWSELRKYCNERNIGLIGDIPIYISRTSVDTWSNTRLFQIDANGRLERVAGVPGDAFNPEGQRWNAPLYRWDVHKDDGYAWWIARLRNTLKNFDAVRLDHFIGFYNYYSLPPEPVVRPPEPQVNETGETEPYDDGGEWVVVPQDELFRQVLESMPYAQFIAEDLGVMKKGVVDLRDRFHFPGMNVFQFAFDFYRSDDPTVHWQPNSVVCTGTHDTMPLSGWYDLLLHDKETDTRHWNVDFIFSLLRSFIGGTEEWKHRFGHEPLPDGRGRDWPSEAPPLTKEAYVRAMVEATLHSPGNTAIFPMQDILALGPETRMNFPGHAENNWIWRLDESLLDNETADRFAYLTWLYRRK